MGTIVCATRGGEASRTIQLEAIRMAKEEGKKLIFFYVVDLYALGELQSHMVGAMRKEMTWFGRALLEIARNRAARLGVKADLAIRDGAFTDELKTLLAQTRAEVLILGQPKPQNETRVFTQNAIETFAAEIEHDTGVRVLIISSEEEDVL